ncbi:MAG: dephospho-CoA kinase [Rickettsiales bacterium]
MTIIIGITGGMASGKTTLARMFVGPGVIHVDADTLVHQLMQHDRTTIAAVAAAFPGAMGAPPPLGGRSGGGQCLVQPLPIKAPSQPSPYGGGSIDRATLAAHIAKHPGELAKLEAILHPRVRALEEKAILDAQRQRLRAVILDVPLLFETDADQLCDVVIVAHAPLKLRRQRAFRRLGMSEAKWQRLISRQLPDAARHHRADVIVSTAHSRAATQRVVRRLKKEWGLK